MLKVENLTVGIKKEKRILKAVKDISFSINEGEIIGLAGESGCGKSMTALSITNLLPLSFKIINGNITYNNLSLTNMKEKELCRIRGKEIGMIFQDAKQALNPLMKIGRQITEVLEINRELLLDKEKKLVLDLLKELGFEDPLKIFETYPHQLSGGMCQRVMAAIAAINSPKLIIADEPSSSLDEESQQRVLSLLVKMNRENKTSVLIISHDLSIIKQYCSRILIMYAGKIIEECHAETLYSPLHPYTNALINAIPSIDKRGQKLESISGKVPSIEDELIGCPFAPRCAKAQNICYEGFPPGIQTEDKRLVNCYFPVNKEKQ